MSSVTCSHRWRGPSRADLEVQLLRVRPLAEDARGSAPSAEGPLSRSALQADGDPEQALRWMEMIAERYPLLPPGFTLEDFKKHLEKERLVERTAAGLAMAPAGERALRQESLDRIFSGLSKDAAGDHRVAAPGVGQERLTETRPWSSVIHFDDRSNGLGGQCTPSRDRPERFPAARGGPRGLRDRAPLQLRHRAADRYQPFDDPLRRGSHHSAKRSRSPSRSSSGRGTPRTACGL